MGTGIILAGGVYWLVWARLLPWLGGYKLHKETFVQRDGWTRSVFVKIKKA